MAAEGGGVIFNPDEGSRHTGGLADPRTANLPLRPLATAAVAVSGLASSSPAAKDRRFEAPHLRRRLRAERQNKDGEVSYDQILPSYNTADSASACPAASTPLRPAAAKIRPRGTS